MKLHSNNLHQGYFDPAFGMHGQQFIRNKKPSRSFQLSWSDVPSGTKSLALIFTDEDAIPVCGFTWIHWTVVNIDPSWNELPENASLDMDLTEGLTSWSSGIVPEDWRLDKADDMGYGGFAPPDRDHQYTVELYALDTKLDLQKGFYKNELMWAMQDHILAKASLYGQYKNKAPSIA